MKKKPISNPSICFCLIGIEGNMFDLIKESKFFKTIEIDYNTDFKICEFIDSLSKKTNLDIYYNFEGDFFIGLDLRKANRNKSINKLIIDIKNSLSILGFTDEYLNNVDILLERKCEY